jgi:hypothetical protein
MDLSLSSHPKDARIAIPQLPVACRSAHRWLWVVTNIILLRGRHVSWCKHYCLRQNSLNLTLMCFLLCSGAGVSTLHENGQPHRLHSVETYSKGMWVFISIFSPTKNALFVLWNEKLLLAWLDICSLKILFKMIRMLHLKYIFFLRLFCCRL